MHAVDAARTSAGAVAARVLLTAPHTVLATETPAARKSHEAWMTAPARHHLHLPHRLDVDEFLAEAREPTAAPWPSNARVIVGLFRAVPVKRPELWLQVVQSVLDRRPEVHAVLVGGHAPDLDLPTMAAAIGPRCHLVGPQRPAAPWLVQADVLLHTSLSEGVPNACLEASALGVPVVAAAVGGVADAVISGQLGLLVTADAPAAAYAAAIEQILDDPTWRERVATAGPATVRAKHGRATHMAALRALRLVPSGD
jgi:glycosyltransferase involved in cell wall biosynthesis